MISKHRYRKVTVLFVLTAIIITSTFKKIRFISFLTHTKINTIKFYLCHLKKIA